MTPLLYTLGVLAFVLAILASIGLHELGHMIPAKAFGGKVTQYFIGFGPTVWSRRKGETEYGLKAVPLGGYVKIVGMLPPGAEDLGTVEYDEHGEQVLRVRKSNTGMFTQLISDARAAEWEHVSPGDEDRLFYKMTWWKKVVVMAGGPTVNILIAFFIFWGIFATVGNVERVDVEPVVDQVVPCIVPAAEDGRACTARELEENPSPAAAAGLQPGDRFVSFNGTPVTDWKALQTAIRENDDKTAAVVVDRDGQQVSLEVTTQVVPRPVSDDVADTTLTPVGFLGVQPVQTAVVVTGGPIYTLQQMDTMAVNTVKALGTLPVKVFGVGKALLGLEERAVDSPVSIVGGGRIAGEYASADAFPVQDKLVGLLALIAGFNFFIGMFNFLPILPLDGGHIAGALYEAMRRGWARLRHRPDPGYVDVAKLLPIAYVMASAFLVMGVVLILADVFVPLHLNV